MRRLILAAGLLIGLAPLAHAQIVTYTFDGSTATPTTVATNVTASSFTLGSGVTGTGYVQGNPNTGQAFNTNGYGAGFDANDYVEIVVSASAGFELDLTEFFVDLQRSSSGPTTTELRTSVDNYASAVGTISTPTAIATGRFTVDLSGAVFQDLPSITIRLYAYGASAATGTLRFDNVTLSGTVAVAGGPPPAETASVTFDPTSATVVEGQSTNLTIVYALANADGNDANNPAVSGTVVVTSGNPEQVSFTGSFSFPTGTIAGATTNVPVTAADDGVFTGTRQVVFGFDGVTGGTASGTFTLTITDDETLPILATYSTVGRAGNESTLPTTFVAANLSATPFTRGPGLSTTAAGGSFNSNGWSQTQNVDPTRYIEVSLAANSGFALNLTALSFGWQRSATGPQTLVLRSSLDGFAADVATLAAGTVTTSQSATLSLSAPAFQSLAGTTTFRLYGYGATGAAGTFRVITPEFDGSVVALAGPITVTRTAQTGRGYRLLSAPVEGVTVGTLADLNLVQSVVGQYPDWPFDNLFLGYNGTGYTPAANVNETVEPGRGFFWLLYDEAIDPDPASNGGGTSRSYPLADRPLTAAGPALFENVDRTFPLNTADGFYMLGNPFAQGLRTAGVTQTAGDGIFSNFLQMYDPNPAGYVVVSRTSPRTLSSWQGFFAEIADGTAAPTFRYLASERTADSTLVSREAAPAGVALRLVGTTAEGTATRDEAAHVHLSAEASLGWDAGDASKLTPPGGSYALVAVVGERQGAPWRQAVRSLHVGPHDVPLAVMATDAGSYRLTATAALPEGWRAELRDLATGATTTDLAAGLPVELTAETAWTERFVLALTSGVVSAGPDAGDATFDVSALRPNPAAGASVLTVRVPAPGVVRATVLDALGRVVQTAFDGEVAASADVAIDASRLAPGVYVVRIDAAGRSETRRLTVVR